MFKVQVGFGYSNTYQPLVPACVKHQNHCRITKGRCPNCGQSDPDFFDLAGADGDGDERRKDYPFVVCTVCGQTIRLDGVPQHSLPAGVS